MLDEQTKELMEESVAENLLEEIKSLYEIFYISKPFEADDSVNLEKKIVDTIKNYGGEIVDISKISKFKMSYPIKSFDITNSQYIRFYVEPDKIEKIDKDLKFINDVLRFIILKIDETVKKIETKSKKQRIKKLPIIKGKKIEKFLSEKKSLKIKPLQNEEEKQSDIDLDKKLDEILENELLE